ncbi:MAG TPA: hypothetical protein VJN72_11525 [Gaiellales bacterium]|nr:hypothetical protein [Gaiellales bacterium]
MATVELRAQPAAPVAHWSGFGFGLVLEAPEPFPGLPAANGVGERVTSWREVSAEEIEGAWRLEDGETLLERRHPNGRLFLRIDSHERDGFRIWAPYYGRHLVALDGCSIASALPRVPPVRWQRLFFAEVLPLSAALQGLSVFHASAAAVRGKVLAFIGPSGSGKTSLTAHLVALGASFFTDEVLVLESGPAGVLAYPGAARLSIDEAEVGQIPSTQKLRVGPCVGRSGKLVLEPEPYASALPLGCVYFLRPDFEATRITFSKREDSPGKSLLGTSFINYLRAGSSLERQPNICADLDRSVRLYDIGIPRGSRARDVAARVLAHCDEPHG